MSEIKTCGFYAAVSFIDSFYHLQCLSDIKWTLILIPQTKSLKRRKALTTLTSGQDLVLLQ